MRLAIGLTCFAAMFVFLGMYLKNADDTPFGWRNVRLGRWSYLMMVITGIMGALITPW